MGTLLLSLLPSAQAETFTEGFESFTAGDTDPETADFTFSSNGASTFVSTAQAHTGTKSLKYEGLSATNGASLTTNTHICSPGSSQVWVYMDAYPDSTDSVQIIWAANALTDTPTAHYFFVSIFSTGVTSATIGSNTGSDSEVIPGLFPLSTWVDFNYVVNCSTTAGSVFSAAMDAAASVDATGSITADSLAVFTVRETAPDGGHSFYVDDISWEDGATATPPGSFFCAVSDEENFGYDYVEQVDFSTGVAGIGLNDFYHFDGDSGDSRYLGKAFPDGSDYLSVVFNIEAATDSTSSVFRVAYTTGAATLAIGATDDGTTDMTTAGNGQNTGNFANNVQVEFTEEGNNWRIKIRQSIAGGSLTTIGSSVLYGSPNLDQGYNFTIDSRGTGGPLATLKRYPSGDTVISARETGFSSGQDWKDQWFVGSGTSGIQANTALDNNDAPSVLGDQIPSTCIYDWLGTATEGGCYGSCGGTPNDELPIDPDTSGGGGGFSEFFDPDNIDSQLFIGFLLVAGMVFMGIRQGGGQAVIGSLFFVGLFLAYSLGWMPLWVILVIFTISLAAIFVLPQQSKDGV